MMIPTNNTSIVDEVSGFRDSMSHYLMLDLHGRRCTARGAWEL